MLREGRGDPDSIKQLITKQSVRKSCMVEVWIVFNLVRCIYSLVLPYLMISYRNKTRSSTPYCRETTPNYHAITFEDPCIQAIALVLVFCISRSGNSTISHSQELQLHLMHIKLCLQILQTKNYTDKYTALMQCQQESSGTSISQSAYLAKRLIAYHHLTCKCA